MSFQDIKAAVIIDDDFSNKDKNTILGVIKEAYAKSSIARDMLDHWVEDLGRDIKFIFKAKAFEASLSSGKVYIDMNQLDHASYIDKNGNAVRDFPFTGIIHELGHALTGRLDNWTSANPAGENQLFVNKIYKQAGYTEQLAYIGYDASGDVIQRGVDYTDGMRIDSAWVKKYPDMPNDHDTTYDGNFSRPYRDLVIGSADVNEIKTGGGDDFLYGLAGDDSLIGDAGSDRLNGGEGADTLNGGGGTDYASYKLASAGVTANIGDTSQNTLSALGDVYISIEGLIGSDFADILIGDSLKNIIDARRGNDDITGGGGNDKLDGGKGVDTAHYDFDYDSDMFDLNEGTISGGDAGKDHLVRVEFANFDNGVLDLDTGEFTEIPRRLAGEELI